MESEHHPKRRTWWPWGVNKEEKIKDNLTKQFDGRRGFDGHLFYRPTRPLDIEQGHVAHERLGDYGAAATLDAEAKCSFRNKMGQEFVKHSDVGMYLSPTHIRPKRLVVQSTDYVLKNRTSAGGDWSRKAINGDIPTALRISEWGLKPFQTSGVWSKIVGSLRILMIALPLQLLLAFPGTFLSGDKAANDKYVDFPSYQWGWPKHAINPLDQRPGSTTATAVEERPSSRTRISRPRKLYVQQPDGTWKVVNDPPKNLQYIFISYAAKSFKLDGSDGKALVRSMAQEATRSADCTACWVDTDCIDTDDGYQKDADIYGMCDVIRGSKEVVVILPDDAVETKRFWGSRMWTLPEALLGPGSTIKFLERLGNQYTKKTLTLVEMTGEIWDDSRYPNSAGVATRLLAEHFSGDLTLGRIELFVAAVEACYYRSKLDYTMFTPNDVTLAVMGLLHHRLERDDDDTAFQSLARLSLSNDNDRIIERMVSLLYPTVYNNDLLNPFCNLIHQDIFSTRPWHIQPTCHVVGVADEDNTVILDSCRVMHIRWKGFPRILTAEKDNLAELIATIFATAGAWWFFQSIYITMAFSFFIGTFPLGADWNYYRKWIIAGLLVTAAFLSLFGPVSVHRLYGGQVLQSASNLVGFEGVMPIHQLERLVFGANTGRLTYGASSTPFGMDWRDHDMRIGNEPDWVKECRPEACELPKGHRLFTLVDTGSLTVNIFSAERPPVVGLLCGREGGMLRAVLCSWRFENNCLFKETVIRMPTSVWDAANLHGWLKVCLATMSQQEKIEKGKLSEV